MFESGNFNSNKETIKSILSSYSYDYKDCGNYIQTQAKWRLGNDIQSVTIYPSDNICKDWVSAETFDVNELLLRVMGAKTQEEMDKYLQNNNLEISEIDSSPKIKQTKKFGKELLNYIDKTKIDYILSRGISKETAEIFECGEVGNVYGKLKNRFTFPIFNTDKSQILGFIGRSLDRKEVKKYKYLHFGQTTDWVYPSHLNDKIIEKTKCVILVESIFCAAKLYDCGMKNVLCLFGVELKLGILNYLLRKNIEKIIISTNNEPNNNNIGNDAALKIKKKLNKYFDNKNSIIKLPFSKDFAEMDKDSLQKWMDELQIIVGCDYFD